MTISISKFRVPEELSLIQTRAVMKSSFEAQFADYRHFHRHWMGTVTVLVGTSTAGKTSIVEALKQANSNLIEDGLDLREVSTFLKLFKKHSPDAVTALAEKMELLSIYEAVFTQKRSWKPATSDSEKIDAESDIQKIKKTFDSLPNKEINALFENMEFEMFDKAFERSYQGLSSVFDIVRIDNFVRHRMMKTSTCPLKVAIFVINESVYFPLRNLASCIRKRNRKSKL